MRILLIGLVTSLLLVGCQQEAEEKKQETVEAESTQTPEKASEAAEPAAHDETEGHRHTEADEHGHDHAPQIPPGERYQEVAPQAACEAPVVMEFYAYHCPHCNDLEPFAEAWREKNNGKVKFVSVPTHLGNEQFGSLLLVHHAAKKLGVLDKAQHALFERFHKERKLFDSPEAAADFLVAQGAEKEAAVAAVNDQEYLSESMKADFLLLSLYKVVSVPQVLVNHRYMTNITAAGGHKEVFEVVDELLEKPHNCGPDQVEVAAE